MEAAPLTQDAQTHTHRREVEEGGEVEEVDVVVIGSGIAGLSCAGLLAKWVQGLGFRVQRVGCRV